ncbi:protein cordon-bleu isoform X3 [Manis pentadactyla]|uniref:protein cordon-bleu isoform X3 n=1 Tax=Manis pentadactyla TaxID=143292 RepID=UPI00255CBD12|nr:protein cordon-bleu isoform X3 [Manis pentadactyla]
MDAPSTLVAKPPTGRKMKARAPPPPGKPATVNVHSEHNPPQDASPGPQQNLLNMKENLQNSVVAITVVLPSGLEKRSVVNGSRAMMDLLVELCLQNHLNPSHHALEIRSLETQQPLSFKPSTLVGTLNVHTVFLKEKVCEEKVKPGPPKAPEKSVRLVVNYLRTQKAVVRVSPEVPLRNILPVICAKCEVSPEHVVLLRDNTAGEELELSKSLNELGIKELYAWDNKRVLLTKTQSEPSLSYGETFRKSSLGNEETDKEKKKFLGFFRANKRSNSKGCVTTPNSPAVNPRSAPLGPSLSLSNISGVSVKSDMKKRRAPPPPPLPGTGTGPPAQDKPSEKVSLGSQIDLQKKKRRAPAPPPLQPPPPSPVVPARTDDKEEHRKSGAGVGRQVPQKPPRGSARGPPQLVLPPPPPYPPPDMDVAEPLSFPGQNAGPEASDLTPTLSLLLGPGSPCSEDGVPPALAETEETVSVGSCFASEDTTEDSGVMSSPSDIISLDSQHDSTKSKDKWATDQEDCSDQDLAGTPELGPQKSPSWERSSSGTWHPRSEKAAISSNDEDLFITGQFQKTLAELNEDLEEMEESYETDTSSPTSSVNGMSNGCTRDTVVPHSDVDTIPVTFIGEVLDDPVDLALFSNRNNNAGSFDMGNIASRRVDLPPDHAEHSQEHSKKRTGLPNSAAVSHGVGKQLKFSVSQTCKDVNLNQGEPKMTSAAKLHTHDLSAKEKGREPTSTLRGRTQAVRTATPPPVEEKEGGGKNGVSAPPSWYQRAQNSGGSYGLKYGLTTYKIVPPKSEMRCYDRGVSLSVGAIKIDELGNLVCPRTHAGRTTALPSSTLEAEMQPIGKVKDFWRSNSMGKQCGRPTECSAKRSPTPAAPVEPQHPESRPKAEPTFPDPRVAPPQQLATHHRDGSHALEGRSRPPTATPGQLRGPAATTEVPFLKPQRRTSSQYVASAIAKRIGTPRAHPDVVRKQDDVQEPHEGRGPEPAGWPPAAKDSATPSWCSESHDREDSGESAVGAHPRRQVSSPHGELCTQHCSAGIHRGSSIPLVPASQRDHVSVGRSCGSSGQQSTSSHRTRSASDPKSTLDSTNPLRPRSDDQTQVRALVNGSRWVPAHSEPPPSSRAAGTCSHAGWEPSELEEKSGLSCTEVHTSNGVLPPSIFGPKKKFRPVVQRPAPRDTCLHSALMEAIHSAGGRGRLRKTTEHTAEGGPKKPSYVEAESERSALLAAIRRHSGACSLRKVSSSASEELQSARDAVLSAPRSKPAGPGDLPAQPSASLPALPPPAPQAPSAARTASRASPGPLSNPAEARQALMDAIRSGTGAARLRKVPLLV